MTLFLWLFIFSKVLSPSDYLYSFDEIYDGCDPFFCIGGVCAISLYVGGQVQTMPFAMKGYYNPNYFSCGLGFKIFRVVELDMNGKEIPFYDAKLLEPDGLYYTQKLIQNYTYCNPQTETFSTSSTAFPFGVPVTNTLEAEYYPELNCTPTNAFLSSSQVYLTNGSRLDSTIGALSIDMSIFTTSGNMVNQAKNESQYVEPGNVMINFTLSKFEWSGFTACTKNKRKAEYVEIFFATAGYSHPNLLDYLHGSYGSKVAYDVGSGVIILSGIGDKDGEIISSIPVLIGQDGKGGSGYSRNLFSLKVPRFGNYYSYGGVILQQDKYADCSDGGLIGGPRPPGGRCR